MKINRKRRGFTPKELAKIQEIAQEYTAQVESKDPLTGIASTMPVCAFTLNVTDDGVIIIAPDDVIVKIAGELQYALGD